MTGYVLGVDLGTSFSAGAIATDKRIELLEVDGGSRVPSTIVLDEKGELLAGNVAERSVARAPERAERNPKRYVGRRAMLLGGRPVTAARALAATLGLFVDEARRRFDGAAPDRLVLTHPVAWSSDQIDVLREAAGEALPEVRLTRTPEPHAAAMHFAHERTLQVGQRVAVYDLGGGTFDAVVLTVTKNGFEPAGRPTGDPEIGGEAFDRGVLAFFARQLDTVAPDWMQEVRAATTREGQAEAMELLRTARRAKEDLSKYETASQWVSSARVDVHISRSELEDLIAGDVDRTRALLAEAIDSGGGPHSELEGIFLTGGASRTPFVENKMRGAYDRLIHTWQDPKTVVALGAARHGLARMRGPGPNPLRPSVVQLGRARDARVAAGALFALDQGEGEHHVLRRIDVESGRAQCELPLGRVLAWDASDHGLAVVEQHGPEVLLRTMGPDLVVRSSQEVKGDRDPALVVDNGAAWVVSRAGGTRLVDHTTGMPWGEVSTLVAHTAPLDPRFATRGTRIELGRADFWYLNENGASRRLLDSAAPTSTPPAPVGDGIGVALVQGDHDDDAWSRLLGRKPGSRPIVPRQIARGLRVDGALSPLASLAAPTSSDWLHQVVVFGPRRQWFLAVSSGLLVCASGPESERRLFASRPPLGALRWIPAASAMFALTMDSVLPNRGVSLHRFVDGTRRDLGHWAGLLGNLVSIAADERPRIRVIDDHLWLGVSDGNGGSEIVRADANEARVVHRAPGWCEPIGVAGGWPILLHAPDQAPGDGLGRSGQLLRLSETN